jgi:hypothetical protein
MCVRPLQSTAHTYLIQGCVGVVCWPPQGKANQGRWGPGRPGQGGHGRRDGRRNRANHDLIHWIALRWLADPALRFGSGPVPGGLIKGDWVLVLSGFKCPLGDLQLNGGVRSLGREGRLGPCIGYSVFPLLGRANPKVGKAARTPRCKCGACIARRAPCLLLASILRSSNLARLPCPIIFGKRIPSPNNTRGLGVKTVSSP